MRTYTDGNMGNIAVCTWGFLALTAALVGGSAFASEPTSSLTHKHKPKTKFAQLLPSKMKISDYSPEIQDEANANSPSPTFLSHSAHWVHSNMRLPENYNCDFEVAEHQKQEAEIQAMAECQATGAEECHLVKVVIAKTGELSCRPDFLGKTCPRSGYLRGCVAEALVLGTKQDLALVAVEK